MGVFALPKTIKPLTEVQVRQAKPRETPYKLFDGGGLFLLINPDGGKLWRMKFRHAGKEKLLSFGKYPAVSLAAARDEREKARQHLASDTDPAKQRKVAKLAKETAASNSFEAVAKNWHTETLKAGKWSKPHGARIWTALEKDIFPWLGKQPISDISPIECKKAIKRIAERGAVESAHRIAQNVSQVFRYAVSHELAERNPMADLLLGLPSIEKKHFSTITDPKRVGQLMRDIAGYHGQFITRCALRLATLVFVRPGELRKAEWKDFDLSAATWRYLVTKTKTQHIVPLSKQALEVLQELQPVTGRGRLLFPGIRHHDRPMSENTMNQALKSLGYTSEDIVPHGFRGMASSLLNEQGWNRDAIERQLSHKEQNSVRAAYNHADYMTERRKMMQAWADYLDRLRTGAEVVGLSDRKRHQ